MWSGSLAQRLCSQDVTVHVGALSRAVPSRMMRPAFSRGSSLIWNRSLTAA